MLRIILNNFYNDLGFNYHEQLAVYRGSADKVNQTYSVTRKCFVQAFSQTAATSGTPFVRIMYDTEIVLWQSPTVAGKYIYQWSPIFPVNPGHTITWTTQSSVSDGINGFYVYYRDVDV